MSNSNLHTCAKAAPGWQRSSSADCKECDRLEAFRRTFSSGIPVRTSFPQENSDAESMLYQIHNRFCGEDGKRCQWCELKRIGAQLAPVEGAVQ